MRCTPSATVCSMAPEWKWQPGAFFLGSGMLLLLPVRWWTGAMLAAGIHELAHIFALRCCGVDIVSITIGGMGVIIETGPISRGREALCALAGPLGSFALVLLGSLFPEAAVCGLLQGGFNLLPVYPLDGGRAVRVILPELFSRLWEWATITFVFLFGLWLLGSRETGIEALLPAVILSVQRLSGKIPCKVSNQAVQ